MTPTVQELTIRGLNTANLVMRHANGDWGDLDAGDKAMNDAAVISGDMIFSMYITFAGKVNIKTAWDRSVTTLYLPGED